MTKNSNDQSPTQLSLEQLSNEELLSQTKRLAAIERETTTKILWHLLEVERRRLFAEHAYSSLFEYAVKELRYSEAAAGRRIAAMRLLRQLPEIEPRLDSGELSLSNAAQVQTFVRAEKKAGHPVAAAYIPIATRRFVRSRASHQCEHRDALTKQRCEARSWLQLDHIIPVACGGKSTPENLRLLCPAHNQLRAIKVFGREKMQRYIPSLRPESH